MNRRENMLAIYGHQPHDHVGNYLTDVCGTGNNLETFDSGPLGGGLDGFGVRWEGTVSALGAGVPAPDSAVLEDVCDWKKVVKFPRLSEYDWEGQAKAQLENYDPVNQIQEYGMWNGQFLRLMHLMGFENGLISFVTEPEACAGLLSAITDYRIECAEYAVKYFKPDSICLFDDFATEIGLFISPDTYRSLIMPEHKRFFDAVRSLGVIPVMHVCGKCEDVVPGFIDEGIDAWQVCQPENDLAGLQGQLGDKLAFVGGYDMKGKLAYTDPTEKELRASVRDTIDAYAPGGNYAIMAMIMYSDPNKFLESTAILSDEAVKYGTDYYAK